MLTQRILILIFVWSILAHACRSSPCKPSTLIILLVCRSMLMPPAEWPNKSMQTLHVKGLPIYVVEVPVVVSEGGGGRALGWGFSEDRPRVSTAPRQP